MKELRIGFGYDAHRLMAGRKLVLGGVTIPSAKGLDGHSDADVLCHAVADAVLGALAKGDIGYYFPPTDPRWKGLSSLVLLEWIMTNLAEHARIVNVDATLVVEAPRISEWAVEMKKNLARVLDISASAVSIKATTNEGMGAVGRGEGIVAHAVVLLEMEKER
jgi:2-C-methyl-D-erythritol 2,4-cyclodiphosphate synthase